MRTHLQFRSPRFIGGANSINPGIDGAKLAVFLEDEFGAHGYAAAAVEEDWGWMIFLSETPFRLWLGCSSYEEPDGWLVFIEPSKPTISKWFRKIDTRHEVETVAALLEKTITERSDATDLKWWSDQDSGRK